MDTLEAIPSDFVELTKTLQWRQSARDRVKAVLDGPDPEIDRIVEAILQNGLEIPDWLLQKVPALQDRGIAAALQNAVRSKRIEPGRGHAFRVRHV